MGDRHSFSIVLLMFVKLFGKVTNRMIYPITIFLHQTPPEPESLASTASLNSFAKFDAKMPSGIH